MEEELRQQQEALRQAQAEAFAAAQDLTRVRNEITALDLQKQGNVVRLEKLSAEKIQLEEERTRLDARLHEFVADVATKKLNAQTQRVSVEQRQQRLQAIHHELESSARQQDQALEQQAGTRSRLNVLEQLRGRPRGFQRRSAYRPQTVAACAGLAGRQDSCARSIRHGHRDGPGSPPAIGAYRAAGIGAPDPGRPQREQGRARERCAAGLSRQRAIQRSSRRQWPGPRPDD